MAGYKCLKAIIGRHYRQMWCIN